MTAMDDLVAVVARALFEREWEGNRTSAMSAQEKPYWFKSARAALAAIETQGWAVVPREATGAMTLAGGKFSHDDIYNGEPAWAEADPSYHLGAIDDAAKLYRAMLNAAPKRGDCEAAIKPTSGPY